MKHFAELLQKLVFTPSRNRKVEHLAEYFRTTPDPDRGYALAAITRDLTLKNLKSHQFKQAALEKVDPHLFALSYDYVGDLAETVALIWPEDRPGELPGVSEFIELINNHPKTEIPDIISNLLDLATPNERWAMIKLVAGGLRIGVSARLAKTALAQYGNQDIAEIEKIWHGLDIPYLDLFKWLDGEGGKPEIKHSQTFHPMMLSNPVDEDKDFENLKVEDFVAEWKWDGIRVQIVFDEHQAKMFSRTGDDISHTFPDIIESLNGSGVLDGELLVYDPNQKGVFEPLPFNCLQQRLNRKTVVKKHLKDYPAFVRVYDMLFDGEEDIRDLPLLNRRTRLETWMNNHDNPRLNLSPQIDFTSWDELEQIRIRGAEDSGHEGVMIKRKDSTYVSGRPKGPWFKWKRDPRLVDAILMYAQRGHGRRSSFYSDYTFGVWKGNELVPIGKAYSGFTDEELKQLDRWIRSHTVDRFGPVREVEKHIVLEIAFDSAHESPRHKSGMALRFPRINRIRWDKPVNEVEPIDAVRAQFVE